MNSSRYKWSLLHNIVIIGMLLAILTSSGFAVQPKLLSKSMQIKGSMDQRAYAPGSNINVAVQSPNANLDPKVAESLEVQLLVWGATDREILTVTETGVNNGKFTSDKGIGVSPNPSTIGDGRLQADPGQVIELQYISKEGTRPTHLDQVIIKGGKFSYRVDPKIEKSVSGEPSRPTAAVINPGGWKDTFIANEIIVQTTDRNVINKIVTRYNGRVLHDGNLSGPNQTGNIQGETGYVLIRVDPERADMRRIEQRMTEAGLRGEFLFSSRKALQLAAIIIELRELQRNATLNPLMYLSRCPCQSTVEDSGADGFAYNWIDNPHFRVHRAWQLLDGIGLPDLAMTSPADSPWTGRWQEILERPPVWAPVNLGIMDINFHPNTDWPDPNIANYDCYWHSYTPVFGWHAVSTWCGGYTTLNGEHRGWHGTGIYGVAAGLLDNNFGSAGSSGMCRGPVDDRIHPLLSRFLEEITWYETAMNTESLLRLVGGADIINMSFGGECNWWCQTFARSEIEGTDMLRGALIAARDQGTIVVAAAGNDQLDIGREYWWGPRVLLPCEGPSVICVGATEQISGNFNAVETGAFGFTWGSNFGEGVDIWAPTDFDVWRPAGGDHNYPPLAHILNVIGGTSGATAYVSGVMALVKGLYPPEQRADFDAASALDLFEATAQLLGVDPKVDDHGGLIDPFSMVRTQADSLGLTPAMADINEPNNEQSDATSFTAGGSISGIAASNDDSDWYRFHLEDYWDLDVNLMSATEPGHIRMRLRGEGTTLIPFSSPPLNISLEPGYYFLTVEDDRSGDFDFNCYGLNTVVNLTPLEADVFDDEDPNTPAPGPWPRDRNDRIPNRTRVVLPDDSDERISRLEHDQLNFDIPDDIDIFQVQLPSNAGNGCICPPGSVGSNASLRIVVQANQPIRVRIYAPRESPWLVERWHELDPRDQGWSGAWGTFQEIVLPCPDQLMGELPNGERVPILTAEQAIVFSIEPQDGRTEYSLDIEYTYQNCSDADSGLQFQIIDVLEWREPDVAPRLFPAAGMVRLWDCLSNPACDPAEEYEDHYIMNWDGGELYVFLNYASPAKEGTLEVSLLNAEGQVVAKVTPIQADQAPHFKPLKGTFMKQTLLIRASDLPAGWYIMKIKAPIPATLSSHRKFGR